MRACLAISVALHALALSCLGKAPAARSAVIAVELLNPRRHASPKYLARQSSAAPNEAARVQREARFLSAESKSAKEETRARRGLNLKLASPWPAPSQAAAQGDLGAARPLKIPFSAGLALSQNMPSDIEVGDFTALSADRDRHFSFYSRFETLFRHHWVGQVRQAALRQRGLREGVYSTRLEIVLGRDGAFQRCSLYFGSGVRGFDAAPELAMLEVKKIPNPPAEMVREDGTVRLLYQFDVFASGPARR